MPTRCMVAGRRSKPLQVPKRPGDLTNLDCKSKAAWPVESGLVWPVESGSAQPAARSMISSAHFQDEDFEPGVYFHFEIKA